MVLRKMGAVGLVTVLFFGAHARVANAQIYCPDCPSRELEDLKTLGEIISWAKGGFDYITGGIKVIKFLIGYNPPAALTIKAIQDTLVIELHKQHDHDLVVNAKALSDIFRQLSDQVKIQRARVKDDEDLAGAEFARIYSTIFNANLQAHFEVESAEALAALGDVLSLPSTNENGQRVAAVLPAYVTVVVLRVSSLKMLSEIDDGVKPANDQRISEILLDAQQTLFHAAGAFVLRAYECGKPASFFYSPVGTDSRWMEQRPLYWYYYLLNQGRYFSRPYLNFAEYELLPVAKVALKALENITNDTHALVQAENVYIFGLYTDPNFPRSKPSFAPCALGSIARVHHQLQ
jgi:hypothetical protein